MSRLPGTCAGQLRTSPPPLPSFRDMSTPQPTRRFTVDQLRVEVYETRAQMGKAAAQAVAEAMTRRIDGRATGSHGVCRSAQPG